MNLIPFVPISDVPFPLKLYYLLEEFTFTQSAAPVVGWLNHGKSFCIYDYRKFEEEVIPKYFDHNNRSSFQRQLNLYGFRKISITEEIRGSYYHPSFQRGHVDLLVNVKRNKLQNKKSTTFTDSESDFSNDQTFKKQKVSQYREYLNSFVVKESSPNVQLNTSPLENWYSNQMSNYFNSNTSENGQSICVNESNSLIHSGKGLYSRQSSSTEKMEMIGLNNYSVSSQTLLKLPFLESTFNNSVENDSKTLKAYMPNAAYLCYNQLEMSANSSKSPFMNALPLAPRNPMNTNMNVHTSYSMDMNRLPQSIHSCDDVSSNNGSHKRKHDDNPSKTISLSSSLLQIENDSTLPQLPITQLNSGNQSPDYITQSNFDWGFFEYHQ